MFLFSEQDFTLCTFGEKVVGVLNIMCSSCFIPPGGRTHFACSWRLLGAECYGCGWALHRGSSREALPGPWNVPHHSSRGPQASNQGRGPAGLWPSLTRCICLPHQSATAPGAQSSPKCCVEILFPGSSERWPNFKQFFTHTKKIMETFKLIHYLGRNSLEHFVPKK